MLWKTKPTLEFMNSTSKRTLVDTLGITFTEAGEDYLIASMPVDERTVQPVRLLHGGASVALAETMGSVASVCCLDNPLTHSVVGVEINANHLNSVKEGGTVWGTVRPIKVGRRIHVWEIKITDERERLICVSRITIAVVELR